MVDGMYAARVERRGVGIGSISKALTSVALLHLMEQGKIDLDTPFVNILIQYQVPANADSRIRAVTVQQIMHHTGGWDTSISGEVEQMSPEIAKALGVPKPTNCADWVRYKQGIVAANTPQGLYWIHNGGCPGTMAEVVHRGNGYDWAMVLSSREKDASSMINGISFAIDNLIKSGLSDSGGDFCNQFHSTL